MKRWTIWWTVSKKFSKKKLDEVIGLANLEVLKKSIFDGDYDPVLEELYGRDNHAVDKQKQDT